MADSIRRGTFQRGLTAMFAEQLSHGALRPLMDAVLVNDLDLEVRRDYINVYKGRNSLLKLEYKAKQKGFRASIHRKYSPPVGFMAKVAGDYAVQTFSLAEAHGWAQGFVGAIPQLCLDSARHDKPEGGAEFRLVRANRQPPFLALDRQVQLGQVQDSKVDVLGLAVDGVGESVVLVELKHGKRLKETDVLKQIDRYRVYYEHNGSLRSDVADRLDAILSLKRDLGLLHGTPSRPLRELPIEFLVVLVTAGSALPPPPKIVVGTSRVYYVGRTMDDLHIPARRSWQILRGP